MQNYFADVDILAQKVPDIKPDERSQQSKPARSRNRTILKSPQGILRGHKPETAPYLQIESVPVAQRIDPKENRYILVIQPQGIRASGGQFTSGEAHEIAKAVKGWDWTLDPDGRLYCLPQLEALLNQICQRSALTQQGGES